MRVDGEGAVVEGTHALAPGRLPGQTAGGDGVVFIALDRNYWDEANAMDGLSTVDLSE